MKAGQTRRARSARGRTSRDEILGAAVQVASQEGLEGLTMGRLASELDMSRSGVIAHFGTKEQLQLDVIEAAAGLFVREVIAPTAHAEPGLERLLALLEGWLSHLDRQVFRGGCFFLAAASEFDDRPGRVRDLIVEKSRAWRDRVHEEIRLAVRLGELDEGSDPAQITYELHSFEQGANWSSRLLADDRAFSRAREAMRRRLEGVAAPLGLEVLERSEALRPERS